MTNDRQFETTFDARQSRRNFMKKGTLAAFTTFCLPTAALKTLEARAEEEGNDVVLRCCVMSDIHFNGSPDAPEVERLKRAINYMYEYSAAQKYQKFNALVVVGDMTNHGTEKELSLYKKVVDEAVRPGTSKMHCMGNHEHYGGSQEFWYETLGVRPNGHYVFKGGYHFITTGPETGDNKNGDYLYSLKWLEKQIQVACDDDPDKPVFVCQHHPVDQTVYGGRGYDNWGIKDLYEMLQRYPRVVNFSGHTHCPINDPRCAWQGRFTAFGTGTLSYLCHGAEGGKYDTYPADNHDCGQFYILEIRRDNSFILKCFDLVSMSFYDVVYYVAKAGKIDDYVYTDERYKTSPRPVWPQDAKIKLLEVNEYGATCEFQQAKCDRANITPQGVPNAPVFPHSYAFKLERLENNEWREEPTQYFWAQYFNLPTPERLRVELTNLEPNSQYRAKVYATNHFLRDSEKALDLSFQTKPDLDETVDRNAALPSPNVLALAAVDGAFVNRPVNALAQQKTVQTFGAPKIVKEDELGGREVAQFNGRDDFYKIQCDAPTYRKLRRASIRSIFKADGARSEKSGAVFGNTELKGIEINVDYKKRVVTLWAYVNGGYKTAEAPLEFDRYVDACGVVDGENVILYLDGKEVARSAARGPLEHPTKELVQAFCCGADISAQGGGADLFTGRIALAQLFSWALTPEQIANLTKEQ